MTSISKNLGTSNQSTKKSTNNLCDRYGITQRTLRKRIQNLSEKKNIKIDVVEEGRNVFYIPNSVYILDQLDAHLKENSKNGIHNFQLITPTTVLRNSGNTPEEYPIASEDTVEVDLSKIKIPQDLDLKIIQQIATQFAIAFFQEYQPIRQQPCLSPVDKQKELLDCVENNLLLTSEDIKFYTGKYPRRTKGRNYYAFGNFRFYMKGLQGKQSVWEVAIL